MTKYTLYGTHFSLYSGKTRAYLRYKNIPYDEVLSTIGIYKKVIIPKTGVRFIPVVKTPDNEYLQDTTYIIDELEKRHTNKSVYPTTPKQRLVSLLLELFGDEWLLIPAMHYRWNYDNSRFIYREFGKVVSPKLPGIIREFIGKKIGSRFKGIVPLLGITNKTIPAIEQWYEQNFLVEFNQHLSTYPFLLGNAPCIGDFGLFASLYAHLYRDPYPGQLMKKLAPNVVQWIDRMKDASSIKGEFLPDDEIPETLLPILTHLFTNQWPVLEDTANRLSKWYEEQGKSELPIEIPRRLGMHTFSFKGIAEERMVLPYSQWMMQRPLYFYQSLSSQEKNNLEPFLNQIKGLSALSFPIKTKVTRINNKFMIN
jgi:glutathione S-transferase